MAFVAILVIALGIGSSQLPAAGAGGLLHPWRRPLAESLPATCREITLPGDDVTLKGWQCRPSTPPRGTVVYLHGVADNRASGIGVIDRFGRRGFEVVAYDSRAHGESGGDVCTYGFFEKRDLHRVLDRLAAGPIVLIGTSLGAAVALQEAAQDPRVTAVVAAETFSDLRTVASRTGAVLLHRRRHRARHHVGGSAGPLPGRCGESGRRGVGDYAAGAAGARVR